MVTIVLLISKAIKKYLLTNYTFPGKSYFPITLSLGAWKEMFMHTITQWAFRPISITTHPIYQLTYSKIKVYVTNLIDVIQPFVSYKKIWIFWLNASIFSINISNIIQQECCDLWCGHWSKGKWKTVATYEVTVTMGKHPVDFALQFMDFSLCKKKNTMFSEQSVM